MKISSDGRERRGRYFGFVLEKKVDLVAEKVSNIERRLAF